MRHSNRFTRGMMRFSDADPRMVKLACAELTCSDASPLDEADVDDAVLGGDTAPCYDTFISPVGNDEVIGRGNVVMLNHRFIDTVFEWENVQDADSYFQEADDTTPVESRQPNCWDEVTRAMLKRQCARRLQRLQALKAFAANVVPEVPASDCQ